MPSPHPVSCDEEAQSVISSPTTSHWLRQALELALTRDCVDAANDAEHLSDILVRRCKRTAMELLPRE